MSETRSVLLDSSRELLDEHGHDGAVLELNRRFVLDRSTIVRLLAKAPGGPGLGKLREAERKPSRAREAGSSERSSYKSTGGRQV
jgi:hypothetical protein